MSGHSGGCAAAGCASHPATPAGGCQLSAAGKAAFTGPGVAEPGLAAGLIRVRTTAGGTWPVGGAPTTELNRSSAPTWPPIRGAADAIAAAEKLLGHPAATDSSAPSPTAGAVCDWRTYMSPVL